MADCNETGSLKCTFFIVQIIIIIYNCSFRFCFSSFKRKKQQQWQRGLSSRFIFKSWHLFHWDHFWLVKALSKWRKHLFHLESSFPSQDISIFILTFRSCKKNGLIRKIILSKIMTSRPGKLTIAITYCPTFQEVKAVRQRNLVS